MKRERRNRRKREGGREEKTRGKDERKRRLHVISYAVSPGCERTGGQASTIDPDRGCTFVRAAPVSGSMQRHRSAVLHSGTAQRFYAAAPVSGSTQLRRSAVLRSCAGPRFYAAAPVRGSTQLRRSAVL